MNTAKEPREMDYPSALAISEWPIHENEVEIHMNGECIAAIYGPDRRTMAYLMAAAPDLLAAVEEILPLLYDCGLGNTVVEDQLRAAAIKATGEKR